MGHFEAAFTNFNEHST